VFELPITSHPTKGMVVFSSYYQYYQTVHGKGIAAGYLSRPYMSHPLFPHLMSLTVSPMQQNFRINGQPINVYRHADALLEQYGYRYLVWHKHLPQDREGSLGYLEALFPDQEPLIDNDLVRVYELHPLSEAEQRDLMIEPLLNWQDGHDHMWWARSPATLAIRSPIAQPAVLRMRIVAAYDPDAEDGMGPGGVLYVSQEGGPARTVAFNTNQLIAAPLELRPGSQTVTVALEAGNFRPTEYGWPDGRRLSFAPNRVELVTLNGADLPPDLLLNGEPQRAAAGEPVALFGSGWYPYEPAGALRWASSPAELLIYSPQPQAARVVLQPADASYHPAGAENTLLVSWNNGEPQPYALQPGEPLVVPVALQTGWNTLHLEHTAGTFRAADVLPDNTDTRPLAFEVRGVQVITEQ
jgi:hypothetical protein